MAGWSTRFLLIFVFICFMASICEARGGRGGSRGGYRGSRYRYRGGGGSYSSGSSSSEAGKIVGIVFGVIGGVVALVVIIFLCKGFCCRESSGGSSTYRSSRGAVLSNRTATMATAHYDPQTTTTSIPYDNSSYKPSYDHNGVSNGVEPPSYESAVNEKEGALPYSSQPNGDLPYSSHPSHLADPSGMSFSSDPSALPYSAHPTPADAPPSAPSYDEAQSGPAPAGGPGPIGFEKSNMV